MARGGVIGLVLAGAVLSAAACDDRSDVPDALLNPQETITPDEPAPPPPRPTTQQFMESERVLIQLDTLPLRMSVPRDWKITREGSAGNIVLLEGSTPYGEAHIQLKDRPPIKSSEFEALIAGAKREAEDGEAQVTFRTVGPVQFMDRRSYMRPMNLPVTDAMGIQLLDEDGQPKMQRSTPMRWRLNVFVPRDEMYDYYELNFIDLSREQFEVDQPFLEQIISTVQYFGALPADEPGAPAGAQSAPEPATQAAQP